MYLRNAVSIAFAFSFVLASAWVSMYVGSIVGLPRLFILIILPEFVRWILGWFAAYFVFDTLVSFSQRAFRVRIIIPVVAVTVTCFILYDAYVLRILLAIPNLLASPTAWSAAFPTIMFYAWLPVLFCASMLMRTDRTKEPEREAKRNT